MSCRVFSLVLLSVAFAGFALTGCNGNNAAKAPSTAAEKGGHNEHEHPSEGPHHGDLIELGKEEYHAELVHDDATHTVTVYVLDSAAKAAVPIDAKGLVINLVAAGKPQQFMLPAKPDAKDPAGQCSCFSLTNEALCEALDDKATTGRINIEVKGKAFVGKIEPHEHDDHKK